MLRPRIIPCLLLRDGALVKTTGFADPKYVGDPLNAVRIFNELEVDELIVLDIDATRQARRPDMPLIASLAAECRMPLCYGGGVRTVAEVEELVARGVEKVALNSVLANGYDVICDAAARVGNQSVVAAIDCVTGLDRRAEVVSHAGTRRTGLDALKHAQALQEAGAGEILLHSILRDGRGEGYDLPLIAQFRAELSIPITALGGAGSLADIRQLLTQVPGVGAGAGSLFVFKGKFRAVLINYPSWAERAATISSATL